MSRAGHLNTDVKDLPGLIYAGAGPRCHPPRFPHPALGTYGRLPSREEFSSCVIKWEPSEAEGI